MKGKQRLLERLTTRPRALWRSESPIYMEPRIERPERPTRGKTFISLSDVTDSASNGAIYRTEFTSDDTHIIVKIPRTLLNRDLRVVKSYAEDGKLIQSATLVVAATAASDADVVCHFSGASKDGHPGTWSLPLKPSLNLNFGFILGQRQFTAQVREPLAPPMRDALDATA